MINVAIFGAGIGSEHLRAYMSLPTEFNVLWVVDRDVDRAKNLNLDHAFDVTDTLDQALSDPRVDLIDICLPPHLHVETTCAALAAGKHVICEKPLATSLTDIAKIKAASASHGKSVYPVFQYRWGPALAQLRHLIETGIAGAPHAAALTTHWSRGSEYYSVPWRGTWKGEQGGAVLGHAIHNHDLMTHFMGPVSAVSAFTTTRVNDIETEDCAAISFQMRNGSVATSSITLGAAGDVSHFRFVFENLTATSGKEPYAPGTAPWSFVARNPAHQSLIDETLTTTPSSLAGFAGFFTEIAADLSGRQNSAIRLQDGAASIELVTAVYHAARSGRNVRLPLSADHPLYQGWLP